MKPTQNLPINRIAQGHVLQVLKTFPSDSVDCLISSPPYWKIRDFETEPQVWDGREGCPHEWVRQSALRIDILMNSRKDRSEASFCRHCNAWRGQLGFEPYYFLFIRHLCDIFDEARRVLKPSGTCWINIADTYESKSLLQIPNLFALEMTKRGWILRNEIIWKKPNTIPNPVRDRFAVDFEKIFFFVKNSKYWFDGDAVREPNTEVAIKRSLAEAIRYGYDPATRYEDWYFNKRLQDGLTVDSLNPNKGGAVNVKHRKWRMRLTHPKGRSRRAVWNIRVRPIGADHQAAYSTELIDIPIKAGCPVGGIVLDPFMGSGTTAIAAIAAQRRFVGIELKPEYIELAEQRIASQR